MDLKVLDIDWFEQISLNFKNLFARYMIYPSSVYNNTVLREGSALLFCIFGV